MNHERIKASGDWARRQVWLLAIAGAAVGGVLLCVVSGILFNMRADRERAEQTRLRGDDALKTVVAAFNTMHSNAMAALSAHVTKSTSKLTSDPFRTIAAPLIDWAALAAELQLPSPALRTAFEALERDEQNATQWRDKLRAAAATRREVSVAVHHAVDALEGHLSEVEGELRLKLALSLRSQRSAAADQATTSLSEVIGRFVDQSQIFEAKILVTDLEVLIARVVNQRDLDNLASLRDNQLIPILKQLKSTLDGWNAENHYEEIAASLFGEGYRIDDHQQTLTLGRGGLLFETIHALQIEQERVALTVACGKTQAGWLAAVRQYDSEVDGLTVNQAVESEVSLRRAWIWIAVFALVANLFLFSVAYRVANTIDEQIRTVETVSTDLMHAQKLESIGQLAAGIAHEINSPMQYICGNIEYLSACMTNLFEMFNVYDEMLLDQSQGKAWATRISTAEDAKRVQRFEQLRKEIPIAIGDSRVGVDRVIGIVRAMKTFSHPGTNEAEAFDMNEAVQSSVTITANRWKQCADMHLELDPCLPSAFGLPAEFNQVVLNLVVNAADAVADRVEETGEKGSIKIRTRTVAGWIRVEVEDTGGGVSDAIRERIFEPFFTTKAVGKGTGQGLALCYNIVVAGHGGKLELETNPGVGSTFSFTAPIEPELSLPPGVSSAEQPTLVTAV